MALDLFTVVGRGKAPDHLFVLFGRKERGLAHQAAVHAGVRHQTAQLKKKSFVVILIVLFVYIFGVSKKLRKLTPRSKMGF